MNSSTIHIVLITYNRAVQLERTLGVILGEASPVKDFRITILDNHSTDNTREIVERFKARHSRLEYHCNAYNVGGNANIAKAIEMNEGEYVWTLCDDDLYHFEHWDEVVRAVDAGEKAICLTTEWAPDPYGKDITYLLYQMTFLPSIMIHRSLLDDTVLRNVYDNTFAMFPHLVPIVNHINHGGHIVRTAHSIVVGGRLAEDGSSFTRGSVHEEVFVRARNMRMDVGFANLLVNLKDRKLAKRCFKTMINGNHPARTGYIHLGYSSFLRLVGPEQNMMWTDLMVVADWRGRLSLRIARLLQKTPLHTLLTSRRAYDFLLSIYLKIRNK